MRIPTQWSAKLAPKVLQVFDGLESAKGVLPMAKKKAAKERAVKKAAPKAIRKKATKIRAWRKVSVAVETRLAAKEDRQPVPRYEGDSARRFGFIRCRRAYKVAKEIGLEPEIAF